MKKTLLIIGAGREQITAYQLAKKWDYDYWDGDRRICYGGYKYIPGRWKPLAQKIIKYYKLSPGSKVLDIGCGTGLTGIELREFCQTLEGIDLSKFMLEKARFKKVYDKLGHTDITEYLSAADLDFDYYVSTDVFVYVGDLTEIFRLIKGRNKRSGKLVFSTEHIEGDGFILETSGRYSHSKKYIESLCQKFDYRISHFEKADLRKEKNKFLTGGLYLLDF